MNYKKNHPLETVKYRTTKYKKVVLKDLLVSLLILFISFLPYIHDIGDLKKYSGFSGFKSLRSGIFIVSMFVIALSGWIFAFVNSKDKSYRFIILAPIFMLSFQLSIYLFDARSTTTNEFTTKIIVNFLFAVLLVAYYFYNKYKKI